MRGLLWVSWLCQGSSAVLQAAVDGQGESAPLQLPWESLALSSVLVLVVVLVLGVRQLSKEPCRGNKAEGGKQEMPVNPEELESRLVYAFSQMERELVKLVTLIRKRKSGLTVRHRSCKAAECQRNKESTRTFNLAVYDIVED